MAKDASHPGDRLAERGGSRRVCRNSVRSGRRARAFSVAIQSRSAPVPWHASDEWYQRSDTTVAPRRCTSTGIRSAANSRPNVLCAIDRSGIACWPWTGSLRFGERWRPRVAAPLWLKSVPSWRFRYDTVITTPKRRGNARYLVETNQSSPRSPTRPTSRAPCADLDALAPRFPGTCLRVRYAIAG